MKTELVQLRDGFYARVDFKEKETPAMIKYLKVILGFGWLIDDEISDDLSDSEMDPFYAKILNISDQKSIYIFLKNENEYDQFVEDWNRANDFAHGRKSGSKKSGISSYEKYVDEDNRKAADLIRAAIQKSLSVQARTVMVTFKGKSGPETMRTNISSLKNLELSEDGHILGYKASLHDKKLPFMPRDVLKITYYRRVVYEKNAQ